MDEYNNYENGYNQNPPPPRRPKTRMNARWRWIIPVLILAAILVMDSFYTLKEDQYAVLTTFGKPTTVSASGFSRSARSFKRCIRSPSRSSPSRSATAWGATSRSRKNL